MFHCNCILRLNYILQKPEIHLGSSRVSIWVIHTKYLNHVFCALFQSMVLHYIDHRNMKAGARGELYTRAVEYRMMRSTYSFKQLAFKILNRWAKMEVGQSQNIFYAIFYLEVHPFSH